MEVSVMKRLIESGKVAATPVHRAGRKPGWCV
jgi:hypothetical protein